MEWDKVKFESFRPSYEKYFDTYLNDKSITEYVSFSKWDSSLIFYKDDFVGFYKTITPDEVFSLSIDKCTYSQSGLAVKILFVRVFTT